MDTVARGEVAESHLAAFISKRDEQRQAEEGSRPAEALYAESTRRYQDGRQRQRLWEWYRFHQGQIRRHTATLEALVSKHRLEAERYAALLGIDEPAKRNGYRKGAA